MPQPQTLYKLIILYMLDSSERPLTNSQIANFMLDYDYTTYFHLQETLTDMVETQLASMNNVNGTSYYRLTEKGATTLSYFTYEISSAIKEEILEYLKSHGAGLRNQSSVLAEYYKDADQEYTARCLVKERGATLIELTLAVPTEEAAKSICQNWKDKCQDVYSFLMGNLL